ncbi:MAG: hypothetical protein AMS27_15360 [Bacteroides sp. SM23_62_1]|nr:MAG: hypothetical protein AMS27_15360 [Bacteroides sp. SM23_62_1]
MREITKAQEDILKALWAVGDGAVTDVIEKLPEPRPAYNTVATVLKVLEKKGYISHKVYGKTHVYYPVISRREYAQFILKNKIGGLLDDSLNQIVTFFVKNKNISLQELEELKGTLEKEIEKQRKKP